MLQLTYSWEDFLKELEEDLIKVLRQVKKDKKGGNVIVPSAVDLFNCFKYCQKETTKAVILGGSPYVGMYKGKPIANGLCYSSNTEQRTPEDLRHLLAAIYNDIFAGEFDHNRFTKSNLELWGPSVAHQGVLMLNSSLTGLTSAEHAHMKLWRPFMEKFMYKLSNESIPLVFLLLGKKAQSFAPLIDPNIHTIIEANHKVPAEFSEQRVFTQMNEKLQKLGHTPINWTGDYMSLNK